MTTKAKPEVASSEAATKTMDLPQPERRSRVTNPADVPVYESKIDKCFVRRDGSSHDVFTPKGIHPKYLMDVDQMTEASAFTAVYYVEQCKNDKGEPPPPEPTMVFGRVVNVRPPVQSFFMDCAKFLDLHEEKRD